MHHLNRFVVFLSLALLAGCNADKSSSTEPHQAESFEDATSPLVDPNQVVPPDFQREDSGAMPDAPPAERLGEIELRETSPTQTPPPIVSQQTPETSTPKKISNTPHSEPNQAFNRLMTTAHAHVEAEQWLSAQTALARALKLAPASAAAQELNADVLQKLEQREFQKAVDTFTVLMQQERWAEAKSITGKLPSGHPDLTAAVQRAASLDQVEREIDRLFANLAQLGRPSARATINRIRRDADNFDVGARIAEKLARLTTEQRVWTTPVGLNLISDGKTTIILRPGKNLGKFREMRFEVTPGDYELIGRREGYREIRRSLSLKPNDPTHNIEIRALERF